MNTNYLIDIHRKRECAVYNIRVLWNFMLDNYLNKIFQEVEWKIKY